ADLFSHSHVDRGPGRASLLACAGTRRYRGREHGRLNRDQAPVFSACGGPPSKSANHRLDGCCAQNVRMASAIGTPMKVPNSPHTKVQKKIVNSTTKGEMDNTLPDRR